MTSTKTARRRSSRAQTGTPASGDEGRNANKPSRSMSPIPVAEALSFLKDTKGALTWTTQEMVDSLKISQTEANQVISILQLQGYVKPALNNQGCLTTLAGEVVSGSKPPRFNPERVNEALSLLKDRLKAVNQDRHAEFRILDAVAYGDFLIGRSRVQVADVGVRLVARKHQSGEGSPLPEELDFLKQLRGKSALVQLQPY